jgi:tRNA-splicing endonuclease subunit Sen15
MTTFAVRTDMKHAVAPAPLQTFVSTALESAAGSSHLPNEISLARQILHNLQHQHYWSDLHVHTHSSTTHEPLPRPLVSGLPPQRLYVHPDEQVELLKKADRERKARAEGEAGGLEVKAEPEREWILPTRLNEKWTLRGLAQVFDAISMVPPAPDSSTTAGEHPTNPWRTTKRVLLASVDTDSTVVYYIVHDGVVKPRQN